MNYKEEVLKIYPNAIVKRWYGSYYTESYVCYKNNWDTIGKISTTKSKAWISAFNEIKSQILNKLSL